MAEEFEADGQLVIRALISKIKVRDLELEFFESAPDPPHWKLADKARRMLVDAVSHFSGRISRPADSELPLRSGIPTP